MAFKKPAMWVLYLVLAAALVSPALAEAPKIPLPHLYLAPTIGVWRWDALEFFPGHMEHRTQPVYGIRAGFARFDALAGEVVVLSGTNKVAELSENNQVRVTQVEFSLLVNFRSLVNARVYPFVDLGLGGTFPSSSVVVDGEDVLDKNKVNYHLGGGVKWDLNSRFTLRLNARDTFLSDSREVSGQTFQNTLDQVEFSTSVEFRIPLSSGGGKGGKRLR